MTLTALAGPLDEWTVYPSVDPGRVLVSVAYGNGRFVAVGDKGLIATSPDGTNWTVRASGTTSPLEGVVFGGGRFLAVGWYGTVVVSDDGETWTATTPFSWGLRAVAYGQGQFVAVGGGGAIQTSPDGITWTRRNPELGGNLWGVAYGNGLFVIVGDGPTILTSPDGIEWTGRDAAGAGGAIAGVAYGNGRFIAVGWHGSGTLMSSPDGVAWARCASEARPSLFCCTYGEGAFVAGGFGGQILTSFDGTHWTRRSGAQGTLHGLSYGNRRFVGAADNVISLSAPLDSSPTPPEIRGKAGANGFELSLSGLTGRTYAIERLDETGGVLGSQVLTTFELHSSPYTWVDPASTNLPHRMYRGVLLP